MGDSKTEPGHGEEDGRWRGGPGCVDVDDVWEREDFVVRWSVDYCVEYYWCCTKMCHLVLDNCFIYCFGCNLRIICTMMSHKMKLQ